MYFSLAFRGIIYNKNKNKKFEGYLIIVYEYFSEILMKFEIIIL